MRQCSQENVNPVYALYAALETWNHHPPLKDPAVWEKDDGGHGDAFLGVAEILARGGVAREQMRPCHTPGGSVSSTPQSNDEPVTLALLPVVGKVLHDRFLTACQADQLDPETAATAALWYWLYQETLKRADDWDDGDDESLKARALRGCARFVLELVAGRTGDGQDTGETEATTPTEG